MKYYICALLGNLAAFACVPADAATFNFARDANVIGERAWDGPIERDGLYLDASGTYLGGPAYAFYDARSYGRNAGLGVCHNLSCVSGEPGAVTSDDNVSDGEVLSFRLEKPVWIEEILFKGTKHRKMNGAVDINGETFTVAKGLLEELPDYASDTWTLTNLGGADNQFYVGNMTVAPVPLPAAFWLLFAPIMAAVTTVKGRKMLTTLRRGLRRATFTDGREVL